MNYNFEEFTSVKGKFTPTISITKIGGIGLSSGFCRRYSVENYKGVKLYFDKNSNVIGLKFLNEEADGMFKLRTNELKNNDKNNGLFFMCKSFFESYAIDYSKLAKKYSPEEISDAKIGKMYIIKLSKLD